MKKGPNRTKGPSSQNSHEKRRTPRTSSARRSAKARAASQPEAVKSPARHPIASRGTTVDPDSCHHCAKNLAGDNDRALFVEEEIGRIFCSESCIAAFFTP